MQARNTLDAEYHDWHTSVAAWVDSIRFSPSHYNHTTLLLACYIYPSHVDSFLAAHPLVEWHRSQTTSAVQDLQPPDDCTATTTMPMTVPQTRSVGSPLEQISEQSVKDLAGVLGML